MLEWGNLKHLREWEESLHNQVGCGGRVWVKRGKKSGGKTGLVPLSGAGEEERLPHPEGPSHSKGVSREGEGLWRSCGDQSRTWKVVPLDC